jgi:hypothetical protein
MILLALPDFPPVGTEAAAAAATAIALQKFKEKCLPYCGGPSSQLLAQ